MECKRRSRSEPCRSPTLTLTTARTYSRCSTRRTEQSTKKPKNQKRTPRPSDRTNPYRPVRSTPPRGHRGRYVDPRPHTTRRRSTPRATRHRQRRARVSLKKKRQSKCQNEDKKQLTLNFLARSSLAAREFWCMDTPRLGCDVSPGSTCALPTIRPRPTYPRDVKSPSKKSMDHTNVAAVTTTCQQNKIHRHIEMPIRR